MVDRVAVRGWVSAYEMAWRTPGTASLGALFAPDVSYTPSPWADPIDGLDALRRFWEEEREGADEQFRLTHETVAVDDPTAIVRVEVSYGNGERWRDLWIVTFDADGRCRAFEEWPFAPGEPDGH
jgi:hypothetical protein